MSELITLTPESLEALVERERGMVQDLAGLIYCAQVYPQRKSYLLQMKSRLSGLSPELRQFVEGLSAHSAQSRDGEFDCDALERQLTERSVHHWLHYAIKDLALSAQEVVLPELIEHYEGALEEEPAGLPAKVRMANALRRLGPAKNVARNLAKVHFRKGEDSVVDSLYYRWQRWAGLGFVPMALSTPWTTEWYSLRLLGLATLWPLAVLFILRAFDSRPERLWINLLLASIFFFFTGVVTFLDARWTLEHDGLSVVVGAVWIFAGAFGTVEVLLQQRSRHHKLAYLSGSKKNDHVSGNGPSCPG